LNFATAYGKLTIASTVGCGPFCDKICLNNIHIWELSEIQEAALKYLIEKSDDAM